MLTPMVAGLEILVTAGSADEVSENSATPEGASETNKTNYNLFNPTPRELMRELAPDRPDKTESPYTVDAGHFQLEMDFANFTRDESSGVRTRAWNVAPFNVKIGLLNNVDLQFVFDDYLCLRTKDRPTHTVTIQSGVGDFTPRVKVNLLGDDGGQTALAILSFVKFPTNTDHLGNNSVEGGLLLPLAVKLSAGFDMGLETGGRFLRNDTGPDHHCGFINSVTLGHAIVGKLDGYLEFFSSASTERYSDWVGTLDLGLTYGVTKNLQLDCGCNIGVTRAASALNTFAGVTVRF